MNTHNNIFGGDDAGPVSNNAWASNANQNSGNFITGRSSTRLHAPPGGASQISFSDGTTDDRFAGHSHRTSRQQFQQQPMQENARVDSNIQAPAYAQPVKQNGGAVSSNAWASNASQNSGNFITDRPTTKIHNPPGGRSQITFG